MNAVVRVELVVVHVIGFKKGKLHIIHSGPENLKSPGQKDLRNQINQFHNFFDQIPFFAISKMAKNQFLNWEEV